MWGCGRNPTVSWEIVRVDDGRVERRDRAKTFHQIVAVVVVVGHGGESRAPGADVCAAVIGRARTRAHGGFPAAFGAGAGRLCCEPFAGSCSAAAFAGSAFGGTGTGSDGRWGEGVGVVLVMICAHAFAASGADGILLQAGKLGGGCGSLGDRLGWDASRRVRIRAAASAVVVVIIAV